jgi:hypothetical protein
MSIREIESVLWQRSSYSTTDGTNCVEVAALTGSNCVLTRDSKDPDGPVLGFAPDAWNAFLHEVKRGALDLT